MIQLRDYQQEASDAMYSWVRHTLSPGVIAAPTGAGKSLIIADIAKRLYDQSGMWVLVTAPNADVVKQNYQKYIAYGGEASICSSSAGQISFRNPVIFGTPGTIINRIKKHADKFCAVIIDESHRLTNQLKEIIEILRQGYSKLRVIGLTATPYRLGEGYIYKTDLNGKPVPEGQTRDPYFMRLVYSISERYLIDQGYIAPPVIGSIGEEHYETLQLSLNSRGWFDRDQVEQAFHGYGRKTSAIVADVVHKSRDRRAVMFFAATVRHAEEIMASLPPQNSALITGKTKRKYRNELIAKFKREEFKYLVNVDVLTTGFDAPHVDVIALLRPTESVSLLTQIVGRGLRPNEGKRDCLVLDYAENIERHCPDGDIFNPEIRAFFTGESSNTMDCECPRCHMTNTFALRKDFVLDDNVDKFGYIVSPSGKRIEDEEGRHQPAHLGRRCQNYVKAGKEYERCDYYWSHKECPECGADNDVAARACRNCKAELIDPSEKLRIEFKAHKKDPTQTQVDQLIHWEQQKSMTRSGSECIIIHFTTEYRRFRVWYNPNSAYASVARRWQSLLQATKGLTICPDTITYKKDGKGFYRVFAFNQPKDVIDD